MQKVVVDTNVLIDGLKISDFEQVIVPIVVIEELDHLKINKDYELAYKAKEAIKMLESADNVTVQWTSSATLPLELMGFNDNKILSFAKDAVVSKQAEVFLSNDYNVKLKAKHFGVPCESYCNNYSQDNIYKGYKHLEGGTYFINSFFTDIDKGINKYGFLQNEYLILYNQDMDTVSEHRYDGTKFVDLKLPPSKIVKGLNSEQRCALDLLNNKDIPIKVVAGNFGSGKTLLSVKTGLYQVVTKEIYKTLLFLRNPMVSDGAEVGYLPGTLEQKTNIYMRPFLQYIDSERDPYYSESLLKTEKIKMDVVSFLKGVSLDDSFIIMDEAEDLNTKLLKLVGSRIGENSAIVFAGDWKQCESKYKTDNGLVKLIKSTKGNPLVGIVVLDEDVRSSASKVFADLV